jgi:hypothetical protein
MISHLDQKLWRDLARMKGQASAVALVMGCGLAMMIMARSLIHSLESTRSEYYEANRFAEVFVQLKRAPNAIAARIAELSGVVAVQAGISIQVTLDVPGLDEPASGMVRSLPEVEPQQLNRLFLRSGQWLAPGAVKEVLVGEAFATANKLTPGQTITMLLNGKRQELRIAGIVLSPEFIFESRPGAALPDNRTYGIFWMPYKEVARAFDLDGAFNYLTLTLAPGAAEQPVIAAIDGLLTPYGGRGAFGRSDHPSHIRVSDEIRVLRTISIGFPIVFLSVAAFMTNAVLSRLLNLQREQIAILKAFGFTNRQIVIHYLKFAFVMVVGGSVLWRNRAGSPVGQSVPPVLPVSGPVIQIGSHRLADRRSGEHGSRYHWCVQRSSPRRAPAASRGDAAGTPRQLPAGISRTNRHRPRVIAYLSDSRAQHRAEANAGHLYRRRPRACHGNPDCAQLLSRWRLRDPRFSVGCHSAPGRGRRVGRAFQRPGGPFVESIAWCDCL